MSRYLSPERERLFRIFSVGFISLVAFESMAVTTAMPTVARAFDGQNLYALALGVVLAAQLMTTALAGEWSDSKGPHSCLYTGVVLLTVGLTICTVSPSMEIFVAGRAIQGLGGGLIIVPFYTIVGNSVQPRRRPGFFTAFAAAWVLPSLFGPLLAGIIVEAMSWRWIFGFVPATILLIGPFFFIGMNKIPDIDRVKKPMNIRTMVIPAFGTGALVACLQIMSGATEHSAHTFAIIGVCGFALLFCARPLFPRGTFRGVRGLPATIATRVLLGTFTAIEMFLPLLLQDVHGWSPVEAGLILSVGSITWAVGSYFSGRITNAALRLRLPLWGSIGDAIGLALVLAGSHHALPGSLVIIGWAIAGIGCGFAFPALSVHALACTSQEGQGRTSSALQVADSMGTSLVAAIIGIIYSVLTPPQDIALMAGIAVSIALTIAGAVVASRIVPPAGSEAAENLAESQRLSGVDPGGEKLSGSDMLSEDSSAGPGAH
ncbi:MFS transporter [Actinotignum sp. GS-2025b]|uniref:MFS transporter n=1 Tax=Actinotignum sp. GS-2025b TaxID=3427275 RepID=UPI003F46F04E